MSEAWPDDADLPSTARAEIGERVRTRLARNPMVSRIQTDKAELFLRHGLLSPQECTQLMALVDEEAIPSKLFSGSANADYRTSSSGTMRMDNPLAQLISKRVDTLMGLDGGQGELLQGQRYDVGQEYKVHSDYFTGQASYWPQMLQTGGQRVWTTMFYLCDVEEGGETHFPRLGLKVPPRRGTLLIWNNMLADGSPNGDTYHAALPVIRGRKYVMTRWYRERTWVSLPAS